VIRIVFLNGLGHQANITLDDQRQEICFIPDNDYTRFLREYLPESIKPGPIIDKDGNTLGEHHGIISFTIGQRHGMGLAAKEPLYVTDVDASNNAIVVGTRAGTYTLSWVLGMDDPEWMPPSYYAFTIYDEGEIPNPGGGIPHDMRGQSSLEFYYPGPGAVHCFTSTVTDTRS
jgi:tRNA U34 2-thiouridine synthase MnmA/TrmU